MRTDTLIDALLLFHQVDSEMSIRTMLTFLLVAKNPGMNIITLSAKLDTTIVSASRNVFILSKIKNPKTKELGHDLVISEINPDNAREKRLSLTSRGEHLYSKFKKVAE